MLYDLYKEQQKRLKKLSAGTLETKLRIKNMVNCLCWIEIESHLNILIRKEKEIIDERHNKKFI